LQRYLFHRTGARFVRCRACELVYADPVDPTERGYFDIATFGAHDRSVDKRNLVADFTLLVRSLASVFVERTGRAPRRVLLIGRWHRDFLDALGADGQVDLAVDTVADEQTLLSRPLTETFGEGLAAFDIVLLNEFLEATHDPALVLRGLAQQLRPDSIVAVAYSNMASLPSRLLRRRWKSFFDQKIGYYSADNLEILMWRCGLRRVSRFSVDTAYSLGYLASRFRAPPVLQRALTRTPLGLPTLRVASGHEVIVFAAHESTLATERLSIIVPVYNEERYVGEILRALIEKELSIEKEIVVVESKSDDKSREIVRSFEHEPGVRIILEDRPRGKGHAVRTALDAVTGSIVLIQDADFEYDIDDYEALLEPILQRHASFVLGSRSLGLDDWKVRKYAKSRVKGFLMNSAQVVFAETFNLLYQQKVTDINTMLKVFRTECIDGCHLAGNGFNFDIELVCKIVRNGFSPLEVPVNYVARGFEEGKKINFLFDAYPSYFQLFRCRLGTI
jgi:Glycosyl transferase family 2/Methyltransferase domain